MRKIFALFDRVIAALLTPACRMLKVAYIPYVGDFMGLGNRLKGLANFYAFGSRRFLVLWRTEGWVTAPWRDLFAFRGGAKIIELNESMAYKVIGNIFRAWLPHGILSPQTPFWGWVLPPKDRRPQYLEEWNFGVPGLSHRYSIDFQFDCTEGRWKDFFVPFFKILMPSEKVMARVAQVHVDPDMVAVQIRNSNAKGDNKDVASVESIMAEMDACPKRTRFFISAMKLEIAELFHNRYGQRLIELPNKQYSSMVDAVADMYLIGECKTLICSPNSSFSEVAYWWGLGRGNDAKVRMLNVEYRQGL